MKKKKIECNELRKKIKNKFGGKKGKEKEGQKKKPRHRLYQPIQKNKKKSTPNARY